ncbi:MerR family transcriptional regulator [Evansella sp. AB-rgal1]|uniref:MerR family transcriptional regulator n=1 Tax=Evansella sp. AB-rgal1 TaxID=3242696 RepID=UPI00359DF9CC
MKESVKMMKTKDVAEMLGVSQKTVRRWIKLFQLPCEVNEVGHYIIKEHEFRQLKTIHDDIKNGRSIDEMKRNKQRGKYENMVSSQELNDKFNNLLFQIDLLDRKIQTKAEDIIEIQTLQHRREIDEITDSLEKFNQRLSTLEQTLNKKADNLLPIHTKQHEPVKKRKLASIFSL